MMNYIKLLNKFNDISRVKSLSMHAIVLYYKTLDIWNRAGRPSKVAITNQRLLNEIQATDIRILYRARLELEKAGVMNYVRGYKNTPGKYELVNLEDINVYNAEDEYYSEDIQEDIQENFDNETEEMDKASNDKALQGALHKNTMKSNNVLIEDVYCTNRGTNFLNSGKGSQGTMKTNNVLIEDVYCTGLRNIIEYRDRVIDNIVVDECARTHAHARDIVGNRQEEATNLDVSTAHSDLDADSMQVVDRFNEIRPFSLTSSGVMEIKELLQVYGLKYVFRAVDKALNKFGSSQDRRITDKRILGYAKAILRNWASDGYDEEVERLKPVVIHEKTEGLKKLKQPSNNFALNSLKALLEGEDYQ